MVHNVFYVSQLSKCIKDERRTMHLSNAELGTNLTLEKQPNAIVN